MDARDQKILEMEQKIQRLTEQLIRIQVHMEDIKKAVRRNGNDVSRLSHAVQRRR